MERSSVRRWVLAADAVGCAAAAALGGGSETVLRSVDPTRRTGPALPLALLATSGILAAGAVRRSPTRRNLSAASAVNLLWVAACLAALPVRRNRIGTGLIAATAVLDGGAAAAQWVLRNE